MIDDPRARGPKFRPGDKVVLAEGPYAGTPGLFLRFRADVNWAEITERNSVVRCHPVVWLRMREPSGVPCVPADLLRHRLTAGLLTPRERHECQLVAEGRVTKEEVAARDWEQLKDGYRGLRRVFRQLRGNLRFPLTEEETAV